MTDYKKREDLNALLHTIETNNKEYQTHSSIVPPRKYAMRRELIEDFYKIYDHEIVNTITEKPSPYSMLRFDFDIAGEKYSEKLYTDYQLKFIITKIQNQLLKVIDDYEPIHATCCLLEKEVYEKKPNTKQPWSGGFHLQFPYVFIDNKEIVRRIIEPIKKEVLEAIGLEFDEGALRNNWYMYGSCKDHKKKPYILTKIYNVDMKEMTTYETFQDYKLYDVKENTIEITPENINKLLPRIFSINPFNRQTQELKPDYNPRLNFIENDKKKKPKKNDDRDIDEKLAECRKLLPLLNSSRVDDYNEWFNLGCILYSIGNGCDEALELWDEKSQECDDKYESGVCDLKWEKMVVGDFTLGTLHYYARIDSPTEYEELFTKKKVISWVRELMFNFSDLNCAEKFKEYNEGEAFFTESHKWVIFNRNTKFWSFNNNEKSLVYIVSKFFSEEVKKYQIEFTENYDPKNKDDEELLKMIIKIHKKVGMTKFATGVISQLQALLTENSDIMERFDTKPNLIAFKNGKVIDLERNGESRDIIKEDFIITHTGYDLPKRDNNDIELVMNLLMSLVETQDDLKVVLSALSCNIYGKNKNELFFIFTGSGGNGKGLLDAWLFSILGNYYKTININQLTTYEKDGNRANSELTKCHYARCVMTSEPENNRGTKLITPIIKKWTGNDLLTTRELHGKTFQFCPRFTLSIQCNGIPDLSIDDGGIRRRMKCIELPYKFKTNNGQVLNPGEKYADDSLKEKVKTPSYRNAFLFILIDNWIQNNGKFYESVKVKKFTDSYFESQNPVKIWFNENYEVDDSGRISPNTLLEDYRTSTEHFDMGIKELCIFLKECCQTTRSNGIKYKCKKKETENEEDEEEENPRLLPRRN